MPPHLPLVLFVIFALECFIVLHTIAPVTAPWATLVLGGLATSAIAVLNPLAVKTPKPWVLAWSVAEVAGVVFGEAIAYFMAVPWELSWICFTRSQHHVEATMVLRLVAIGLATAAWRMTRRSEGAWPSTASRGRAPYAGGLALGLMAALLVAIVPAVFPVITGHRPSLEVEAESRAAAQLGPDYAGYRYLVRRLDQVFRRNVSVTIEASVIAYDAELGDLHDVTVTWKEPWD
ncbi:hypothetical protein [Anaeromyxobacter sp. SG26]|uniref:hypothetical protein n=1 Tax=Anaeromyxobacter sp. SG26 TaxID=2925407 RepID=UPI001F570BA4|nr:hypothetical protein [Anaeromyxobacter sp. SG26]